MLELISEDYPRSVGLGAVAFPDGVYFSVWAPRANSLVIHLYTVSEIKLGEFTLTKKKGGIWYGFIKGAKPGMCYALEALGTNDPQKGYYFQKGRFLVDPYAMALNKPFEYTDDAYENHNEAFIPKAIIQSADDFNWEGTSKVFRDRADVIIYEAHVRGMTKLKEDIPSDIRGTYLGMCHPSVIAHLKHLGVTTIQLLPVAASMTEPFLVRRGQRNYWGYNPVCFMAPNPAYARDPLNAINEFKTMVKTFHQNGLAVILDVVFNHTAEGDHTGPIVCYKGLDARSYYAYDRNEDGSLDFQRFLNVTGCGNSFNADCTISLRLIMDSLRYWLSVMQVDGFRFDLASTICRESHGDSMRGYGVGAGAAAEVVRSGSNHNFYSFDRNCGFFKAWYANDVTRHALMIAEPWDIGYGGYQLGKFPSGWSEQNDKFRDTVRRFWRGDRGLLGELATRMMGSRDVFTKGERSINASVNYVTYHDGFTLEDLVSYSHKHNELNLEENRDGTTENFSCNCGEEGPTRNPEVIKRRWQLKRNLMTTMIISQGIPHIVGGDELSRTQLGNNNGYCQDNDLSYTHWNISQEQRYFMEFISRLLSLLNSSRVLREINLFDDDFYKFENAYIAKWRKSNGYLLNDDDWHNLNHFMLYVGDRNHQGERWCVMVNNEDHDLMFAMPSIIHDRYWHAMIDSSEHDGIPRRFSNESGLESMCAAYSIKILKMEHVSGESALASDQNMEQLIGSHMLNRYAPGNTKFQY